MCQPYRALEKEPYANYNTALLESDSKHESTFSPNPAGIFDKHGDGAAAFEMKPDLKEDQHQVYCLFPSRSKEVRIDFCC